MKKLFFFISLILITGCLLQKEEKTFFDTTYREQYVKNNQDLKEEWKEAIIKGEIPLGMEKSEVEKILGKNYKIYISKTGMMEVWIYNEYYVGFDKDGKVIKFGILKVEKGEK
ncbi:MAG: hypothetical protein NC827_01425 [Candidatus Omnitrophica bacterium]|nr:hypothetical protein [Candidatus Omnitrophota bacterium]MCM8801960.1 hypothetical protein [Candidatus Omnitrophota bacterium]